MYFTAKRARYFIYLFEVVAWVTLRESSTQGCRGNSTEMAGRQEARTMDGNPQGWFIPKAPLVLPSSVPLAGPALLDRPESFNSGATGEQCWLRLVEMSPILSLLFLSPSPRRVARGLLPVSVVTSRNDVMPLAPLSHWAARFPHDL